MSPTLGNIIVLFAISLLIPLLFLKKARTSELWQATVTPLASIIGSGFCSPWSQIWVKLPSVTRSFLFGRLLSNDKLFQQLEHFFPKNHVTRLFYILQEVSSKVQHSPSDERIEICNPLPSPKLVLFPVTFTLKVRNI